MTTENWTAMYMGMKWAAAFMDPNSRPIVDLMITDGDLNGAYNGWPHSWTDNSVRKIVVLMSDGDNTRLHAIRDTDYPGQSPAWWDVNRPGASMYRQIDNQNDGVGDAKLSDICDSVKLATNTIVYTIGFEVSDNSSAQAALLDCATDLTTYYLVEGVEISTAFRNIADEITNLKLLN